MDIQRMESIYSAHPSAPDYANLHKLLYEISNTFYALYSWEGKYKIARKHVGNRTPADLVKQLEQLKAYVSLLDAALIDLSMLVRVVAEYGDAALMSSLLRLKPHLEICEGTDVPLAMAIRAGKTEIARLLIEAGANCNPDTHGEIDTHGPLYEAVRRGDIASLKLLIARGAPLSRPRSAFVLIDFDALRVACRENNFEIFDFLRPLYVELPKDLVSDLCGPHAKDYSTKQFPEVPVENFVKIYKSLLRLDIEPMPGSMSYSEFPKHIMDYLNAGKALQIQGLTLAGFEQRLRQGYEAKYIKPSLNVSLKEGIALPPIAPQTIAQRLRDDLKANTQYANLESAYQLLLEDHLIAGLVIAHNSLDTLTRRTQTLHADVWCAEGESASSAGQALLFSQGHSNMTSIDRARARSLQMMSLQPGMKFRNP